MRRVAVIMGGRSCEREVSLESGRVVLEALDRTRYRVQPIVIESDGRWTYPVASAGGDPKPITTDPGRALARLIDDGVEVAFLALHGTGGEDGAIQGFLSTGGIPFTGTGVSGSALAMDKIRTKEVLRFHGVQTPDWVVLDGDAPAGAEADAAARLGFPIVAKSPSLGSTIGIHVVDDAMELAAATNALLELDDRVLLEAYVDGVELTCGVLDGVALPPTQILAGHFDYEAKYSGRTEEITPPLLPAPTIEAIGRVAERVHRVLGLTSYSRTDFRLAGETLHVLETNTLPGMTPASLFPQAAAAAGLPFPDLLDRLIEGAIGAPPAGRPVHPARPRAGDTGRLTV